MESATSVYMCFPCYQEFETLEEVLKHQLTCNAEATEPAPDMSGLASIAVQQTQVTGCDRARLNTFTFICITYWTL